MTSVIMLQGKQSYSTVSFWFFLHTGSLYHAYLQRHWPIILFWYPIQTRYNSIIFTQLIEITEKTVR